MRALIAIAVCTLLAACSSGGQPTAKSSPSPPITYGVPDACGLITEADIVAVAAQGVPPVTVEFFGETPTAQTAEIDSGPYSRCSRWIHSSWPGHGGTTDPSLVAVRYQTGGAAEYFPIHSGDVAVPGLGDEAMIRERSVYVRVGAGVLLVQASIRNPAVDESAQEETFAKDLAVIALQRLRPPS